ncbi:hypothetical protein OROMI_029270 [Orobanche minor]
MSIKLNYHIFAGNPINKHHQNDIVSHSSAFKTLKDRILNKTHDLGVKFEVLAFRKDMPLAGSVGDELKTQNCHLGWLNLRDFRGFLDESWGNFTENEFMYLGSKLEKLRRINLPQLGNPVGNRVSAAVGALFRVRRRVPPVRERSGQIGREA